MCEEKKRKLVGDIGAFLAAGFTKVTGDIGTAYQQILLQDSPLSVQTAVDNAIGQNRGFEPSREPEAPQQDQSEPAVE